jgi:16S rRNA (adenine1518-N6/adenine1519-N6)-dimethyltransferase
VQKTRAKKSLGQNFLADGGVAARIVGALGELREETVVEIGPGRGALTGLLVARAGRVVAVELDRELAPLLREKYAGFDNLTVVEADALEVDFAALIAPAPRARVVANLPYYISTAILQRLLAQRACLAEMVLMLQREVVERIAAPPGGRERGYLSVLTEACAETETLFDVPPGAFRPVPQVWSSVVRLRVREHEALKGCDEALLWRLVSAGFAQRRKTIANGLKPLGASDALRAAEIDPNRRAETLTLEEWTRLATFSFS